jgi:hypothetical protein
MEKVNSQLEQWYPTGYLIGKDPRTAPLQLRAAIALSACKSWENSIIDILIA